MKYTIFVDGEIMGKQYPGKLTQNCVGQTLVYDGPSKSEAKAKAELAAFYFEDVRVFKGEIIGRLTKL